MGLMFECVFLLVIVSLTACQSTSPIEQSVDARLAPSKEDSTSDNLPQLDPAIISDSGRRYCSDDIYSLFLQENYLDRVGNPSHLGDKHSFRQARQEAHLEAYWKLNADLPVAFGGLPVQATQRVLAWIEHFTGNGRQSFLLWLVRSESFRSIVVPLLEQEGLPSEFFFLAMIESGFSNLAFSRSSASGTWQFMKPTARHYGLAIDYWIDERRDPAKSTLAAARYLKDLHRQFQDWYLAIAAYNAGPNKITRAIRGAKSRDYWAISRTTLILPETKNYVPKMLAALIIASHPEHYGFAVSADIRNTTPLSVISLESPYRLADIAQRFGIPPRELQRWNPELLRGITPPRSRMRRTTSYSLRLPRPLAVKFSQIEPQLARLSISDVQLHRVQRGDTFNSIAKRFGVSTDELRHFNPELKPQRLKPGQNIAVPVPDVMSSLPAPEAG